MSAASCTGCSRRVTDWQLKSSGDVTGRPMPTGHYIPEEAPDALAQEIETFCGG